MTKTRLGDGDDIISSAEIRNAVQELGQFYTHAFSDKNEILVITVLQGALFFAADLVRSIQHPNIILDTFRANSYEDVTSTGKLKILQDISEDIQGKHVLIVEDIIDTGITLSKITKYLQSRQPAGLSVVSLLEKPDCRAPDTPIDAEVKTAIRIHNSFVVGYGLDWNGRYRTLPFITKAVESSAGFYEPLIKQERI